MLRALLDDPDLRLHGRLTFGRGRRWLAPGIVFAIAVVAFLVTLGRGAAAPSLLAARLSLILVFGSFVLIVLTPFQAVARLMEWQNAGRLDLMRLTGRKPLRILAMAFFASSWSIALGQLFWIGHALTAPSGRVLLQLDMVAYVVLGSAAAALSRFALSPLYRAPAVQLGISVLFFLFIVPLGLAAFMPRSWLLATGSLFHAVAIAVSVPIAAQRIRLGASQGVGRDVFRFRSLGLARFLPETSPAELRRALVFTLSQPIALWSIVVAVLLAIGVAIGTVSPDPRPGTDGFDPNPLVLFLLELSGRPPEAAFVRAYVTLLSSTGLLLAGVLMTAAFVRREVRSGAIDLVRLTRQSPLSVVAGWMVGASLPFWLAAFPVLAFVLAAVAEAPLGFLQPFLATVGTAVFASGLALLEALERKPTASYFILAAIAAVVAGGVGPALASFSPPWWPLSAWAAARWWVWQHAPAFLLTPVVCAGMAASRFAPSSPVRLPGTWALAGVAWVSALSALNGPRSFSLPAFLVLAGSLFGDPAPIAPVSRRLLLPAASAFLLATTTSHAWRFDPVLRRGYASPADLVLHAVAAALAVVLGILVHETCGRVRCASPATRLFMVLVIAVFWQPGARQVIVLAMATALFAGIHRGLLRPTGREPA